MGKYMVAVDPVLGSVCLLLRRGMDVYNAHFSKEHHDDFYTSGDIMDAYSRYITTIVKRFANEPAVLGTPLSIIIVVVSTHLIPRLGARQRPTMFLGSSCVGELQPSDDYSMDCNYCKSCEG